MGGLLVLGLFVVAAVEAVIALMPNRFEDVRKKQARIQGKNVEDLPSWGSMLLLWYLHVENLVLFTVVFALVFSL